MRILLLRLTKQTEALLEQLEDMAEYSLSLSSSDWLINPSSNHSLAEVHDDHPVYARRYYEPVDTAELSD